MNYGASQTFTITPAANYHVADVLVDGASVGAVTSYTFTNVTANHTIAASFAIDTYTITASAGANGTITPAAPVVGELREQTRPSPSPRPPATTWPTSWWTASPVGAVTSYTFTNVTANHTIAATFAINTYTITASAGANGTISPAGTVSVNYGAEPDLHHHPRAPTTTWPTSWWTASRWGR